MLGKHYVRWAERQSEPEDGEKGCKISSSALFTAIVITNSQQLWVIEIICTTNPSMAGGEDQGSLPFTDELCATDRFREKECCCLQIYSHSGTHRGPNKMVTQKN